MAAAILAEPAAGAAVGELAEPEGWAAADAGAEAGAAERLDEATAGDAALGWAWRRKFQKARSNVTSSKAKASLPHGIGAED